MVRTVILSFVISLFSTLAFAGTVDLPYGYRISSEGYEKIQSAESIPQFLEAIENDEGLRILAVNHTRGNRTQITVPERYGDTSGRATAYFQSILARVSGLAGIHLKRGTTDWNPDHAVLLICKDALLHEIIHEYLHFLIHTHPHNSLYSFFSTASLSEDELIELHRQARGALAQTRDASKTKHAETPNMKFMNEVLGYDYYTRLNATIGAAIYKISEHFLKKRVKFEEIAIQSLLMDRADALGLDRYKLFSVVAYTLSNLKELNKMLDDLIAFNGHMRTVLTELNQSPIGGQADRNLIAEWIGEMDQEIIDTGKSLDALGREYLQLYRQFAIPRGDINLDGEVTEEDYIFLREILTHPERRLEVGQESMADLDQDGLITVHDLTSLRRRLQGGDVRIHIFKIRGSIDSMSREKIFQRLRELFPSQQQNENRRR